MTENSPKKYKQVRVRISPETNEKLTFMLKELKAKNPNIKISKSQLLAWIIHEIRKRFKGNEKFREKMLAALKKL